jgi:hypothetical protein
MRIVRHSMRRRADRPMNVDFSMADLHEMLNQGQITQREFERLRQALLVRAQARAAQMNHENPPLVAGHGFEVIQNPPPLPPDDQSRDAR